MAKLTDFGVARVIGGDTLTMTGDVLGTLAYMAPEQAEGLEACEAADLYSLALVTYEALSGVNPVANGALTQRSRRLGAHLPPLRRQRRDLPQGLGQSIDFALRPRPRERGTITDLRAGLAAVPITSATSRESSPTRGRRCAPSRPSSPPPPTSATSNGRRPAQRRATGGRPARRSRRPAVPRAVARSRPGRGDRRRG